MTQAFNLAQLANNLNTSGQLDATDGLNGLVANANLASSGTASSTTFLRGDRTWAGLGNVGKILQVVSTTKTDTQTIGTTTTATILSASITPSATSSRILIIATVAGYCLYDAVLQFTRNGTLIGAGDAAGSRVRGFSEPGQANRPYEQSTSPGLFVDSPSSTSALTYIVQGQTQGQIMYINRSEIDENATSDSRTISSLVLMEIGA